MKRLQGEEVEARRAVLVADDHPGPLKGVGGVAPVVAGEEAAIHQLEGHPTHAKAEGESLAERAVEIQLAEELDGLQGVHVAVVERKLPVVPARVLELDGEPQRIEELAHPQVGPGAEEEGEVTRVPWAGEVVLVQLEARTQIEADIEPVQLAQPFVAGGAQRAHIGRRFGLRLRAVAARVGGVAASRRGLRRGGAWRSCLREGEHLRRRRRQERTQGGHERCDPRPYTTGAHAATTSATWRPASRTS